MTKLIKMLIILLSISLRFPIVGKTNTYNWEVPRDIYDNKWEEVYDYLPDHIKTICLGISNIEVLDSIIYKIHNTYADQNRAFKLSSNSIRAIILEALSFISNIKTSRNTEYSQTCNGYFSIFEPQNINKIIEWYKFNRLNINLKLFSKYIAADCFITSSYHNHIWDYHTNLSHEEDSINEIFLLHIFISTIPNEERAYIARSLGKNNDNSLIISYIKNV